MSSEVYPPGSSVRFVRDGLPFIGRIVEDDPHNHRAKVRIETPIGAMHAAALTTIWVDYERITGRI